MWPFGSKERFSKAKVTKEGVQLSAPLDAPKHVSKAAMEDAEKAKVRENYEKGIEKSITPANGYNFLPRLTFDRFWKQEADIRRMCEDLGITKDDLIKIDADLEDAARKAVAIGDGNDIDKKYLDKLKNSSLIALEGYYVGDGYYAEISRIKGEINGRFVEVQKDDDKYSGISNGENMSSVFAKEIFEDYWDIAKIRTNALKELIEKKELKSKNKKDIDAQLADIKKEFSAAKDSISKTSIDLAKKLEEDKNKSIK